MNGMNRQTGHPIEGVEHIHQSVADILTTPVGSRVMRRTYGSLLPRLIDQPLNEATVLRAYSATVSALRRWEPRLRVNRVTRTVEPGGPGLNLTIQATTTDGDTATLNVQARPASHA